MKNQTTTAQAENPLGTAPIGSLIAKFAIPAIISMLVSALYNIVDQIFIGQGVGMLGNAATNIAFPVTIISTAAALLLGIGSASNYNLEMGAGNEKKASSIAGTGLSSLVISGGILTVIVLLFLKPLLHFFGGTADVMPYAIDYMGITAIGLPFYVLSTGGNHLIRADRSPTYSMTCILAGAIINTILDPLFIFGFGWGIKGAAWATVISQGVSGVACLVYMVKKFEILRIHREEWKVDGHMMMVLCGMGVPMGLQYSITAIGSVILQTAANTLGSAAVAAMTAGGKIGNFLACPFDAMGSTMATYGGQNVGAGKLDRLGKGLKSCVLLGVGYSVIAFLIAVFFGGPLAQLFVDGGEAEIIANVCAFLLWNTAFYIPLALVNIVRFLIQGMGFPKFAILAGVFEMIARSLAGFGLVPIIGFTGVCLGSPIAWIMADAFLIPAYFHVSKVLQKRMVPQTDAPQAV